MFNLSIEEILMIEPLLDMTGLEVSYSTDKPNSKAIEREHIAAMTEAFLSQGGEVYQAKRGESRWLNEDKVGTFSVDRQGRYRFSVSSGWRENGLDFRKNVG